MRSAVIAALALACATLVRADTGVDVSSLVLPDSWQCMANAGYTFAIIRGWQSNGVPDPNCPHTVYNAWDGGMKYVDVYLFPCYSCGNPAGQVSGLINYLQSYNITNRSPYGPPHTFGQLWFDIEGPGYWSGNPSDNVNFLAAMVNEANALGIAYGIYSSPSQWNPIMGGSTAFSGAALWWPNYDGVPNMNTDWNDFGGWSHANIKQYQGTSSVCNAGVDLNYYP